MNLWNYGWANIDEMYDLGFDLINCNDGNYYIVPNAGYYYDYLNDSTMYNLAINTIGGFTVPAGDEQMKGGAFAVWNDMTDYLDNGVSEYDVYNRIKDAAPLFAAKLWGKQDRTMNDAKALAAEMDDGPDTNFGYEVEADEDGVIAEVAAGADDAIELKGGADFVATELTTAGLGNDLRVIVKRTSDSKEEQILFESAYGSIKAVQKETGKPEPTPTPDPWKNPFKDVSETKSYYDAVAWGSQKDVVAGMSEDMFSPMANCTRAQIVSFLWRAEGRPEPVSTECKFTDLDSSKWYETSAQWSYENGIVSGYDLEEGKAFAPDNQIERAETVTMLYRYYN